MARWYVRVRVMHIVRKLRVQRSEPKVQSRTILRYNYEQVRVQLNIQASTSIFAYTMEYMYTHEQIQVHTRASTKPAHEGVLNPHMKEY